MDKNSIYQQKYLKYKSKYTELKNNGLKGGAIPKIINKGRYMRNLKGGAEIILSDAGDIPSITGREIKFIDNYEQKVADVQSLLKDHKQCVESIGREQDLVQLSKCKKSLTGNVCQQTVLDNKFKVLAIQEGYKLYTRWITERKSLMDKILDYFDVNGNLKPEIQHDHPLRSATWFNDLYKWTMFPVVRFVEGQENFREGPVMVTFQVDIREESVRKAIAENEDLRRKITEALDGLRQRPFIKAVFDKVNASKGDIIHAADIDKVCNGRTLVQRVDDNKSGSPLTDGVVVRFYQDPVATYNEGDAPGLWIIEAEGPWHLVTWLETSMMQAVYEAYHKWDLVREGKRYGSWLSTALLRCACSVAYTQILQRIGGPTPALFTGRRTGGLPFLILQNLFFVDHFQQANGPSAPTPTSGLYSSDGTACLGTSSVDAQQFLEQLLKEGTQEVAPIAAPVMLATVGTHAHELSMVLSVLYHKLDVNSQKLPFSQVLGHYLYKELVWEPLKRGPLPMLPDTLGTPSFVLAASILKMEDGSSFLDAIGSGRQDSGNLVDFKDVTTRVKYVKGCMASEIDDTSTLLNAFFLTYTTFGAGGFFGDSNKAWNSAGINISMAVKVVRVIFQCATPTVFKSDDQFSHIQFEDGMCFGYPIKTGDAADMNNEESIMLMSKFSVDKTLSSEQIRDMKAWAIERRAHGYRTLMNPELLAGLQALQLNLSSIIVVNSEKSKLDIIPFGGEFAGGSKKLLLKRK
jgi:hypothetical protein